MEAVLHGFDNEAAGSICEDPVELSTWEVECLPDAEAVKLVCRTLYGDGYEADSE